LIESDEKGGSRKNDTSANDDFLNKMQVGDYIIVKKGRSEFLGYGIVTSDYIYDEDREDYKSTRKVDWKLKGSWNADHSLVLKTLTDITTLKTENPNFKKYSDEIMAIMKGNKILEGSFEEEIKLLRYKKQIILQGPPGTGKTRMAKMMAKQVLGLGEDDLKKNEQFKLIQFHPSYTYEDFVRGIVAKPNENGDGILYEAENKTLGDFAERALKNYQDAQKDTSTYNREKLTKQYFDEFVLSIQDEIDKTDKPIPLTESIGIESVEENGFRIAGMTKRRTNFPLRFKDVIQGFLDKNKTRQEVRHNENLNTTAMLYASYTYRIINRFRDFLKQNKLSIEKTPQEKPSLKNYILVIDEINHANLSSVLGELIYALEYRGEEVESMYEVKDSKRLILPPNLYIIGTMNTADRSVGHIDYAIRRRFAFMDVLPKDISDEPGIIFHKELFDKVKAFYTKDEGYGFKTPSKYLSMEFDPKNVALGHSYFIDKSAEQDGASMKMRLEYEIKPILREYVNDGILIGDDILDRIDALKV